MVYIRLKGLSMAMNQELLLAIQGLQPAADDARKVIQLQALDALIKASLNPSANPFREQVIQFKDVFSPAGAFNDRDANDDNFLSPGDDGGDNNLRQLQREAAKKRIELSLPNIASEIKTNLFKAENIATLRDLLGQEAFGNLSTSAHWNSSVVGGEPTLTDDVLTGIQRDLSQENLGNIYTKLETVEGSLTDEKTASMRAVLAAITDDAKTIKKAKDELAPFFESYNNLQKELEKDEHAGKLDLHGNAESRARIDALRGQAEALQALIPPKMDILNRVVQAKSAEVLEQLRLSNVPPPKKVKALHRLLTTAEKSSVELNDAFELEKMSGEAIAEDITQAHKAAEKALIQLKMTTYAAEANELHAKIEEITNKLNGADKDLLAHQKREKLALASQHLEQLQKVSDKTSNAHDAISVDLLSAEERAEINAKADAIKTFADEDKSLVLPMVKQFKKPKVATTFMESESNQTLNFTDEVVIKGKDFRANLPLPNAEELASEGRTSIKFGIDPEQVLFKGVRLEEGDVIRSTANFQTVTAEGGPGPIKKGILVQDHRGKVTDWTDPAQHLSNSQKAEMAIKQAKMLLVNYRPGCGAIIIKCADKEQGQRLYAAVLLLKKGNPELNKLEVISNDVEGPGGNFLTRGRNANAFIEAHLPQELINRNTVNDQKKQVGLFVKGTSAYRKELNDKREQDKKFNGSPDEKIDHEEQRDAQDYLDEGEYGSKGRSPRK